MQTIVYQCDTAMPAQKLPNCCIYRLSEEITTFTHGYSWIVWRHQNNHLGLTPAIGVSPNFNRSKKV